MRDRLESAVRNFIRPAFQRQRDVIIDEVLPASPPADEPGVCWLDDGDVRYPRAVHRLTSLPMDPREIHEIGLQQIAALRMSTESWARRLSAPTISTPSSPACARTHLHFTEGAAVAAASEAAMNKAREEDG